MIHSRIVLQSPDRDINPLNLSHRPPYIICNTCSSSSIDHKWCMLAINVVYLGVHVCRT